MSTLLPLPYGDVEQAAVEIKIRRNQDGILEKGFS
jgi:hypothetical protein